MISLLSLATKKTNEADDQNQVWKVFSQQPLSEEELNQIFKEKDQVVTCNWLAYPHYSANQTKTFTNFKLEENLYHINAIEWAASAMEMSVIGAKNVANMIIQNLPGPIREKSERSKDEL